MCSMPLQMAALDFIGCAVADAFAMTDSGSQLASLASGYRIYYGEGHLPTIRPNKRRLAYFFSQNLTMQWDEFEERVRKTVRESKQLLKRPVARSIYRHPRCNECMCHWALTSDSRFVELVTVLYRMFVAFHLFVMEEIPIARKNSSPLCISLDVILLVEALEANRN